MATVYVGSARIDENGKAYGGRPGDQNGGKEVSRQKWYRHSKGWRVFRAKKPETAAKIAEIMQWACDTDLIGYDKKCLIRPRKGEAPPAAPKPEKKPTIPRNAKIHQKQPPRKDTKPPKAAKSKPNQPTPLQMARAERYLKKRKTK